MEIMNNKVTIVLAGNREQYENYVIDTAVSFPGKRFVYGFNAYKILGSQAEEVVTTGTFWQRHDARKLFDLSLTRVFK